ncbi:MAG: T9SS type A sorting domain-containing protein [Crocinitomicaceae bacterium]
MKNIITFFYCIAFLCVSQAQGTIIGFSISPQNPTSTDTIYVYADIRFTSSNCELSDASFSVNGSTISANAHHCLGIAAAICSIVDTFKINPLADGNYSFDFNLTSGAAPAPCTAGIIPDDDSTFTFSVGTSKVTEADGNRFRMYPNPIQNSINLPTISDGTAFELITISGQLIKSGLVQNNRIEHLENVPTGIYFLKLKTDDKILTQRVVKE